MSKKKYKVDKICYAFYTKRNECNLSQIAPFEVHKIKVGLSKYAVCKLKMNYMENIFNNDQVAVIDKNDENVVQCYTEYNHIEPNIYILRYYSLSEIILAIHEMKLYDPENNNKISNDFDIKDLLANKKITIDQLLKINNLIINNKEKFKFTDELTGRAKIRGYNEEI
ncbi:MAG: hypothetical protein IJ094_04125 [Bacilli bacterium]|nr:hypothetical protein [Bacilli bacterium]